MTSIRAIVAPVASAVAATIVAASGFTVAFLAYAPLPDAVPTVSLPIAGEVDTWDASDPAALYPPCANEDGPAPCHWDASHAGNGIGSSFYIGEDFCTYVETAGGYVRDDSFECVDAYATPLGDAIDALAARLS